MRSLLAKSPRIPGKGGEVACKTWNVEWNGTWNGMELGLSFPDHQSLPVLLETSLKIARPVDEAALAKDG